MASVVAVAVSLGTYLGVLHWTGNFHEVVPGKVYRSAQPSPHRLIEYWKRYNIRTIVNLRGQHPGAAWYDEEVAEARRLGIAHVDYLVSQARELTASQAAGLVAILDGAVKPVLLHCRAGSDRSGLAAALYMAAVEKVGEAAAEEQMSLRYGHIPFPGGTGYVVYRSWEALEPWLGFTES